MSKEITLTTVYKTGSRELRSGDFLISFQVDATKAAELLPFHMLPQDSPLRLTIADSEETLPTGEPKPDTTPVKSDRQEYREKLYARIEIHAKEIGYDEEKKRAAFERITGKRSKKDMDDGELESLESELYKEANPVVEPE